MFLTSKNEKNKKLDAPITFSSLFLPPRAKKERSMAAVAPPPPHLHHRVHSLGAPAASSPLVDWDYLGLVFRNISPYYWSALGIGLCVGLLDSSGRRGECSFFFRSFISLWFL